VWTPDGGRLTFSSTKDGRREIYWLPVGSPGEPELLVSDEHSVWPGSWSPDQKLLAFMREPPTNRDDIGIFRLSDRKSEMVVASEMPEHYPRISPDGRWLAYSSLENDGRNQVFIVDVSGTGGKRQVSSNGGSRPVWSRSGQELFYRGLDGRFMVVPVASGSATTGKPVELPVSRRIAGTGLGHPGYDVAADGRLLVVEAAETETVPRQIQVVLNWFAEVKARVPSK
jgi:Tol biopolymer transport system component